MRIIFAVFFLGLFPTVLLSTQDVALSDKERALSGKYEQLEAILLRMAEVNAATNPRRAALLKKVIAESKDRLIALRFEEIVAILQRSRFSQAIDTQASLEKDLAELLKLLESENRVKLRESEKEKLKDVLREIEELILQQRSLKGRTTETQAEIPGLKPVAQEQEKIGDKTKKLAQKMGDLQEVGQPSPKGDESGDESQEKLSPTQQAMQQAQRRMKQAQEQLEKMEKQGAVQDQEEAIAELQKARAELERLLRQLREEELMQTLQYLDARLRKMLQLEKAIRSQTEQLEGQQAESEMRQVQILASRLSVDQSKVIEDADVALVLLQEDGTAQAMKESLEQTRFDMLEVEERLRRTDVGTTTQNIENTIIESLQEMIDAVAQAKKDSQDRSQRDQNSGSQALSQEEQNLIDQLSELRMIRTMQRRVNERTARYDAMLDEGKTDLAVLEKGVDELARQQLRIRQILRDMSLGRNR